MTKPPVKTTQQSGYVKTGIRVPPELHAEVHASAERNGRTFNSEILARLQKSPLDDLMNEVAQLKAMIQQLIDRD